MKPQNSQKDSSLDQIKRLLILAMVHQGIQGKDIAMALGVDPATVTRMIPSRKIKRNK